VAGPENLVLYECADRVATISLNRPEKLNAVSDEVVAQLAEALRRFDLDPEAEVAILTGKGRAFSSGADVHQRQLRSRDEFEKLGGPQGWGTNSADLFTRSVNWKPVVAAVHGYVLGLALGLTLECDLIVAEAGTRFQLTETSRGLGASRYWALFHYRNAAAFGDEIALTGRYDKVSEPDRLVMTVPGDVVTAITLTTFPDDTTQIAYTFDVDESMHTVVTDSVDAVLSRVSAVLAGIAD